MLPVRLERAVPSSDASDHHAQHIHQRHGDQPQRGDRLHYRIVALRGDNQQPNDGKADQRTAGIAHKDFKFASPGNAEIEQYIRQAGDHQAKAP